MVLGKNVLRAIGRSIGDSVEVGTSGGARTMKIVGVASFPSIGSARFGALSLGDGAAVTAAVLPSTDPTGTYNGLFLRLSGHGPSGDEIAALRKFVFPLG